MSSSPPPDLAVLKNTIRRESAGLGFTAMGVAGIDLRDDERRLDEWLALGWHGDMDYMARHGTRRSRPGELVPGTIRILSFAMDYLPAGARDADEVLADGSLAYVSRYALGRDYHRVMRPRLQKLASRIEALIGPFGYRAFVDSAPVLEKPLGRNAGLGWIGKHTNLLSRRAGSWFFLGELYTDLELPVDEAPDDHCGRCTACIEICPTQAIVAPYRLDARRCLSYLTIENRGPIPEAFRAPLGNRIYGCDDCQLVCPWNRFARRVTDPDFAPRHRLDDATLVELMDWSETVFLERMAGSAIRRIGHERWLRNVAVALGNAPYSADAVAALRRRQDDRSALVREHVGWALARQRARQARQQREE